MISLESTPVPRKAQGVLERSDVIVDGRRRIDFCRVLYLQTAQWYADIRVPINTLRPRPEDTIDVNFARPGAFAGPARLSDDNVMTWKHTLDLRENPPTNDSSPLLWHNGGMSEGGTKRWNGREWYWSEQWKFLEDDSAEQTVEISDDEKHVYIAIGDFAIRMSDERPSGLFIATRFNRIDDEWVEAGSVRSDE